MLVRKIKALFAGRPMGVQKELVADLMATFVVGHRLSAKDGEDPDEITERVLHELVERARELIAEEEKVALRGIEQ
jgi:hypothetical protein